MDNGTPLPCWVPEYSQAMGARCQRLPPTAHPHHRCTALCPPPTSGSFRPAPQGVWRCHWSFLKSLGGSCPPEPVPPSSSSLQGQGLSGSPAPTRLRSWAPGLDHRCLPALREGRRDGGREWGSGEVAPLGQAALLSPGFQVLCAAGPARMLVPGPWPRRNAVTREELPGGVAVAAWCWGWLGVDATEVALRAGVGTCRGLA